MILHVLEVAVVFLLMLTVLVAAHEYGHYVFARLFGMGVEEFSIGMGGSKPLFVYARKKYRIPITAEEAESLRAASEHSERQMAGQSSSKLAEVFDKLESGSGQQPYELIDTGSGPLLEETTLFTFRPYPIGGFVRIKGMLPQEEGMEVGIPGGFYSKAPWKRFITLLAGPAFSVMAGVLVMIPLIMSAGIYKLSPEPVIGIVIEGPAAKAGLLAKDRIVSIEGEPIQTFYQMMTKVQANPGKPLHVTYQRGDEIRQTVVTPEMEDQPTPLLGTDMMPTGEITRHALIGVLPVGNSVKASWSEATAEAFRYPVIVVNSLLGVVKRPSTAKAVVGGPGTIISVTNDAVNNGVTAVISVAAEISISVGIFNLLPIFPLDGGQMAVALAEMLRGGRRLSLRVQNTVGVVGLATVLLLVFCVLTVDFGRLTGKQPPAPKVVSGQKPDK